MVEKNTFTFLPFKFFRFNDLTWIMDFKTVVTESFPFASGSVFKMGIYHPPTQRSSQL
jgi:hypothetical protein